MFLKQPFHSGKLRMIAFLAIVVLFLFFLNSERFEDAFYSVIFWGEDLINSQPFFGTIFFFLLSALSAIFAFASTILLLPSAILVWGIPLTFLLLLGGWIAGAIVTYWIGAWLARPALAFIVSEKKLLQYESLISKKAKFWMILLFCLAVPSEIPGFILGAMRYDFPKFISAVLIAETVYALGVISAAQNILDKEIISASGIVFLFIILITAASIALIRMKRK